MQEASAGRPNVSLLIFLGATTVAGVFALLPLRTMLEHFIYEDMFYYLRVAEHLVAGNGSSFDGSAPTNGYHPAWMAISTFAAMFFSGEALVRAMLLFAAVLHGAQALILYRLLGRYANESIALAVTGLFALNWRVISTNLCGLETPLSLLMMLVVLNYLSKLSGSRAASPRAAVVLGLLLGASVYARFDMLLFSTLVLGFFTFLLRSQGNGPMLRQLILAGCVLCLSLLPWFIFSLNVSGTLLPNSREAVALLGTGGLDFSSVEALKASAHQIIFGAVHWVSDSANLLGVWPTSLPVGRMSQLAALILTVFVGWIVVSAFRNRRELPPVLWLALVFFFVHSSYYALNSRLEVRYVIPAFTALLLVLGLVLGASNGLWGISKRFSVGVPVVLFAIATFSGIDAWNKYHGTTRTHRGHANLYDAALWIGENASGATVGAWNAGIISFFSRAEVVNLDGVINDDALAANRAGAIDDYIRSRDIRFFADRYGQIEQNLTRFAGDTALMGDVLVDFNGIVVMSVQ